jgi:hypothetical protein
MANINIDIAAEFVGNKAFKQADTATDKLTKNVKKLAGAFGLAFGTTAVLAYGKAAVKAAAADQKAQQSLALALKNVGLEREAASAEGFIQRLQSEFGIIDDKLRPAYQALAVATRDTAETQRLLNLALDISASTGNDLGKVTAALSRAYLGNNTALSRLGVGISKADLKTKSFYDITTDLAETFKGSATAAANTFQGSMDKLAVASANVQEIIGTGIIDALRTLGGNTAVDDLANDMERAALSTADFLRGLAQIGTFKLSGETKSLLGLLLTPFQRSLSAGPLGAITRVGAASRIAPKPFTTPMTISGQSAQSAKMTKDQAKLAKENLKVSKDQLKLSKAKATFDLQKIQIEAALKGKISKEDEIRLKLMKAILDENITDVEKYQKALEVAQTKTKELTDALAAIKASEAANPFAKWADYVKEAIELTNSVAQASLQAGLAAGAKLSEALSGARYAAQGAAAAEAAANATAIAGAYGAAGAAAAAQAKAAQEALTAGSKAQQEALAAQIKAQQEALEAQGATALAALKKRLAEEKAALEEAAAERAASAASSDTLVKIIAGSAAGSAEAQAAAEAAAAKAAAEQAAQLAAIAAASAAAIAAAEQAAERGSTGGTTKIEVTVTGDPFTDPNAVAEKVVEIIRGAGQRGTVDVLGID